MNWIFRLCVLFLSASFIHSLSVRSEEEIIAPRALSAYDPCDPSSIPVMSNFDLRRFSGSWFELAKSASGYIDVNDGMWKIQFANASSTFLYSGRDSNGHCIRPIKGKIHAVDEPPGMLSLHYQTYSTHVEETIRVLFTDYTSIAVIYLCTHHIHREKEICHAAGIMGAVWTRRMHVDLSVYENAQRYLEMACVHKSILIVRTQIGPCKVDDLGFRIDEFPAPDFCYQPRDLGHCRGSIQRYYYDPKERRCEIFSYSGCGGNKNNFMSLPECQGKCLSASAKDPVCMSISICAIHCPPCCTENRIGCVECNCERIIQEPLPNCAKSPAHCRPNCEVEEFYPGCYICNCDDSIEEDKPFLDKPACLETQDKGECENQIERYYYNAQTEECEKFIYTGCGGNKNNFETEERCLEMCQDPKVQRTNILINEDDDDDNAVTMKHTGWLITSLVLLCTVLILD